MPDSLPAVADEGAVGAPFTSDAVIGLDPPSSIQLTQIDRIILSSTADCVFEAYDASVTEDTTIDSGESLGKFNVLAKTVLDLKNIGLRGAAGKRVRIKATGGTASGLVYYRTILLPTVSAGN